MMAKRIVCVLASLIAFPAVAAASVCQDHADKLSTALTQLGDTLAKYRGQTSANVVDCMTITGELGTIDDESKFLSNHSCWPSEETRVHMDNQDQAAHEAVTAAFHRLGCSQQ